MHSPSTTLSGIDKGQLYDFLDRFRRRKGNLTVLTGAGISAESGIPTFRGPEGYWTVGSQVYRPQQMATFEMFQRDPKAVWQFYLWRLAVCRQARPNQGHLALVAMEKRLDDRFTLITQNVDNLHLRAGQSPERTYQIHGNLGYVRCSAACCRSITEIPAQVAPKGKNESISEAEWRLLRCPRCTALLRPHVLWFDESYDEPFYRLDSSLAAARNTTLLIVAGTSGTTDLPSRIVARVYRQGGLIIDINPNANPFGQLAREYERGLAIREKSSLVLKAIARHIEAAAV
jgi:NAD-dependent protein deacetylase/lipoamidase